MDTTKQTVLAALEHVQRQIAGADDSVEIKLSLAKVSRSLNALGGGDAVDEVRHAIDSVRTALDRGDMDAAKRKLRLAIACAMTDL